MTRNIVLIGRTGRGKSATGNTLLEAAAFTSQRGATAVTMRCELQTRTMPDGMLRHICISMFVTSNPVNMRFLLSLPFCRKDLYHPTSPSLPPHSCTNPALLGAPGSKVNIVDTPGLFDPGLSNAETLGELGRVLELVPGGVIHAALVVLNGDDVRFTAEEQCAMRLLRLLFGPQLFEHAIFVFTRGDYFSSVTEFESQVIAPLKLEERFDSTEGSQASPRRSSASTQEDKPLSDLGGGARALRGWLVRAGRRYVLVNNSPGRPQGQAEALLAAVEENLGRLEAARVPQRAAQGIAAEITASAGATPEENTAADEGNGSCGYTVADFEQHARSLTAAQKRSLQEPLSPERQEAQARALQGEVGGLREEVSNLKTLMQKMNTEQTAALMGIISQMRKMQTAPPGPPTALVAGPVKPGASI